MNPYSLNFLFIYFLADGTFEFVDFVEFSTLKMNALNKYSRIMNFVENDISLVLIAFVVIEKDFSILFEFALRWNW